MSSFFLLNTNVGLTTNAKIVVGMSYSLYIDSIPSTSELHQSKYKKLQFNKDNYWDEILPYFFKGTPPEIAYHIKDDGDNENMSKDFSNQYDDIYQSGARNIINNKDYSEEYEFFAPLHVSKSKLPTNFIIFRVDGPGIINLNKDNFREEILEKLKVVKVYDLTRKTPLGEWLEKNITLNKSFPISPLYIDFRRMEFSSWNGIDYPNGGWSEKSFMLDSTFQFEQTFSGLEDFVINGWKNNKVVYPHILNLSFLFDDNPATPTSFRKWSINRYLGFYMDDAELVKYVSPFLTPEIKEDVIIDSNNIISSLSSENPFKQEWKESESPYIEIDGDFYIIQKYLTRSESSLSIIEDGVEKLTSKWKIISDKNLSGKESLINKNIIKIETEGLSTKITNFDGTALSIDDFEKYDIWLIEISDTWHKIIKGSDGNFYLNTDYGFIQTQDKFEWYVNDPDPKSRKTLSLIVDNQSPPKKFGIWRFKLSEIKTFDTDIINTGFSKFEYELESDLTRTDETKLYAVDHQSLTSPKNIDDFRIGGEVVNVPVSSEYLVNFEIFQISDRNLTNLWKKNSKRIKWGFQNSLSSYDYPYLLNNSFVAEDFNRTVNPFDSQPKRVERNLDWFLTINPDSNLYKFYSLHVVDDEPTFRLDKYIDTNTDYFTEFFGKKIKFNNDEIRTTKKWSIFNRGATNLPNITLFRGIKFNIWDVDGVKLTENKIDTINIKSNDNFDNWKFSILASKNNYSISPIEGTLNGATLSSVDNKLRWQIIDQWKPDKTYNKGTIVILNEILYKSLTHSKITDPNKFPYNSNEWELYSENNIFWSPIKNGENDENNNMSTLGIKLIGETIPPLVWNYGDYWVSKGHQGGYVEGGNFWNPTQSYATQSVVLYKGKIWKSTNTTNSEPGSSSFWVNNGVFVNFWEENPNEKVMWNKVPIWDPSLTYSKLEYVVYDDIVWIVKSQSSPIGVPPSQSTNWVRVWSMNPDTNFRYHKNFNENNNPIISMNGRFYLCVDNGQENNPESTLDNGITVYINKKWKNILINIHINDNTYSESKLTESLVWEISKDNMSNTKRDDLYSDVYSKLTAFNFIQAMNNLENNCGFSDKIKYVVINESGNLDLYDFGNFNSLTNLPILITCDFPDKLLIRRDSNEIKPINLQSSQIKAKRSLNAGNITSIDEINYYNNNNLAVSIERKKSDPALVQNFSGLKNTIWNLVWRHSGWYSPIFKTIELFSDGGWTFDTELTHFGILTERIVSKVNRKENILKLRNNSDLRSQYPQLDEFGYHTQDFFIFKSNWDLEYHNECLDINLKNDFLGNKTLILPTQEIGSNNISQI